MMNVMRHVKHSYVNFKDTVAVIYQSLDQISVSMAWKMKVPWYPINLKKSFNSTSFLFLNIFYNSIEFLIVAHLLVVVYYHVRQGVLYQIHVDVNEMQLQYIFNIERKERAWVPHEFNVEIHFQLLGKMFLIDDEIAVYFWLREL